MILCGIVWGLGFGSAIVCDASTTAMIQMSSDECDECRLLERWFLASVPSTRKSPHPPSSPIACILTRCRMFKYLCRGRAERMTKQDLNYACLSEAVKQGGFPMAWAVRLSVLPTWVHHTQPEIHRVTTYRQFTTVSFNQRDGAKSQGNVCDMRVEGERQRTCPGESA